MRRTKGQKAKAATHIWLWAGGTTFRLFPGSCVLTAFVVGMDARVTSKFIASTETFFATGKGARKRFLSSVSSDVTGLDG